MDSSEKKLIEIHGSLSEGNRIILLAFAEFLQQRDSPTPVMPTPLQNPEEIKVEEIPEPAEIPRPKEERVVAAVKRLSKTYPMLDKKKMLNETATLVTAHIVQGRDTKEVIDELETIFAREYELLKSDRKED